MSPTAMPVTEKLGFRDLPIAALFASPHNPRRHHYEAADADLVESVRQVGILEPLIARPLTDWDADEPEDARYEVVAGHRRLQAAKIAGLVTVPAIVRTLSDAEALEIAVIENNQRKDVHPLDEAEAFQELLNRGAYTAVSLAQKLGRPARYVTDRLRLLSLIPAATKVFERDEISLGHALALARLTDEQQQGALDACFED